MPYMGEPLKYHEVVERIKRAKPTTQKILDLSLRQVKFHYLLFLNYLFLIKKSSFVLGG